MAIYECRTLLAQAASQGSLQFEDDRGMKHTRYILRSEPPKFLHRTKEPNQAPCIDYTAGMSNLWHLKKPLYYEKFQTYLKVDRIV